MRVMKFALEDFAKYRVPREVCLWERRCQKSYLGRLNANTRSISCRSGPELATLDCFVQQREEAGRGSASVGQEEGMASEYSLKFAAVGTCI